ncbi:MAG: DUF6290 family protein [Desulfuromonadales bacterium]|nr:DUF6290 family protein [Desulfuromonadales bacterium]
MPHISLRVSEEERSAMEGYAKVLGINMSEAIKKVFFQRLEDEFDLQRIREHREKKARGEVKMYSLDEVKKELGLDDEI